MVDKMSTKDPDDNAVITRLLAQTLPVAALPAQAREAQRRRLLNRAAASARDHAGLVTVRGRHGHWRTLKPGVRTRLLHRSADGGTSALIELAPGARLPVHRHRHLEEGIVLDGRMQMGELDLGAGDWHLSQPGSRHAAISSKVGALTYLRGTSLGEGLGLALELVGGLWPAAGRESRTVTASDGSWRAIGDGVEEKTLWGDGVRTSRFLRLGPGAVVPGHAHPIAEETLVIDGDVFFGDILVCARELHVAPAGSRHPEVTSDAGALLYVSGPASSDAC